MEVGPDEYRRSWARVREAGAEGIGRVHFAPKGKGSSPPALRFADTEVYGYRSLRILGATGAGFEGTRFQRHWGSWSLRVVVAGVVRTGVART